MPREFADWLTGGSAPPDSLVSIIIVLRDTVTIPPFPPIDQSRSFNDPINVAIRSQADSLIGVIADRRKAQYTADSTEIRIAGAPVFRGRFWLIQAFTVDARASRILPIASLLKVMYVRPRYMGETAPSSKLSDVTTRIRANFSTSAYDDGRISVLDTGINDTHQLLTTAVTRSQANGGQIYDCFKGCPQKCVTDVSTCSECTVGNSGDPCQTGHGTKTASILFGEGVPDFRGVTSATFDWFNVYDEQRCQGNCTTGFKGSEQLDACAAVRGFEMAARRGSPVIIAEMQGIGNDQDPICRAAARAFETGKAIIAANGNDATPTGVLEAVACPAREAVVIGVGARVATPYAISPASPPQKVGPVSGRMKPDILGPCDVATATRCGTNTYGAFSFTSAATAFVGGAASLLSRWIEVNRSTQRDPGNIYAQLILAGSLDEQSLPGNAFNDQNSGAGLLQMGTPDLSNWIGKEQLTRTKTFVEVPLQYGFNSGTTLVVALWWPELLRPNGDRPHRPVKLEVFDQDGTVPRATGNHLTGVFQRVTVNITGQNACSLTFGVNGQKTWKCWRVKISVPENALPPGESQVVYWAASTRK